MSEYQQMLAETGGKLRQAESNEEGWYCELKDFKDTVDFVEELRQGWRIKKGTNLVEIQ